MKKKRFATTFFLIGVLVTTCFFQFVYPPLKDAMAYSSCIKTGLRAKYRNGDVYEDKEFSIFYEIPSCYANYGYSMSSTFIYSDNHVGVTYKNPDFKQGVQGGSGSTGGGMGPIQ